jgi:tetratricopeptide (TPR) repeat protein
MGLKIEVATRVTMKGMFGLLFAMTTISVAVFGQSAESLFQSGNKAYSSGEFVKAQNFYEQSIALDGGKKFPQSIFNLGNTLFQQKKYDEAAKEYQAFIARSPVAGSSEQAWYNIGNSYFATKDYDAAMDAYKKALRINPKDEDARYNLALTMQLTGGSANRSSNSSTKQTQTNLPKSRPLTEEEKRQLLNHLADLEKKTIQDVSQTQSSSKKKSVKDW